MRRLGFGFGKSHFSFGHAERRTPVAHGAGRLIPAVSQTSPQIRLLARGNYAVAAAESIVVRIVVVVEYIDFGVIPLASALSFGNFAASFAAEQRGRYALRRGFRQS